MNIENIRKELTREEFINGLSSQDHECNFSYNHDTIDCPGDIGLKEYNASDCYSNNCKKCWLYSIEDIKFKDEINNTKEYNKEEVKKYKASEIIAMIESNKLTNDDIIIGKNDAEIYIEDIKNDDCTVSYLLEHIPFMIKVEEPVNFAETILIDKNIKVKHKLLEGSEFFKDFQSLCDIFSELGDTFGSNEIREIIKEGQWFIEK